MPDNEKTLYLNEILVEDGKRIKRRQSLRARLAERDRAYAAHLAERDIPFETVSAPADGGGLTVHRRGNCPNYGGAEFPPLRPVEAKVNRHWQR